MPAGANKELVRRFYREAIVERDSSPCERLLSVDFVHNGETRGRAGQRQAVDYFLAAFTSTAVLRIRDGLIAQAWDEMDSGAILAQLEVGDG